MLNKPIENLEILQSITLDLPEQPMATMMLTLKLILKTIVSVWNQKKQRRKKKHVHFVLPKYSLDMIKHSHQSRPENSFQPLLILIDPWSGTDLAFE